MCKYCKVRCDKQTNEVLNDTKLIGRIRDGSQSFELTINRYKIDKTVETGTNELILSEEIYINGDWRETVKELHINIKYCPFCGEKL